MASPEPASSELALVGAANCIAWPEGGETDGAVEADWPNMRPVMWLLSPRKPQPLTARPGASARPNPARAQRWRNSLPTSSFASPSIKWRGDPAQLPRRDERPGAPAVPLDKWSLVTLVDRALHGARERALVGARLGGTCINEGAICEVKARYVLVVDDGRPSGVAGRVMRARGGWKARPLGRRPPAARLPRAAAHAPGHASQHQAVAQVGVSEGDR